VVMELKRRKGRPHKPLAVMVAGLDGVGAHAVVSEVEAELLTSPQQPIVLLRWPGGEEALRGDFEDGEGLPAAADEPGTIDPRVAVRQRYLGVMLPYTPLHVLLLEAAGRPLVMTSGNLAEEPIVKSWDELGRLGEIPDYYLVHDRDIFARYDDSVAIVRDGRPRLLRRSRGYAPFPVALPRALPQILACGAELKNSFCLTRDANAFLSPHIGDLENMETLEHFEASVELYKTLFRLEPELVAYDLHPEYLASKYALELPQARLGVQHHHAHVAACLAEHGREDAVIGVSMDGLGFGTDGRLWGGEIMVCDLTGFRRVAHLEELPLPGGELAIRRPARTAAGWVAALLGPEAARLVCSQRATVGAAKAGGVARRRGDARLLDDEELEIVLRQVEKGSNAPLTTSCGRLFDAVAALAGVRSDVTYEAQAAIELEMVSSAGAEPYPFTIDVREARLGDGWGSMVDETRADREVSRRASGASVWVIGLAPLFAALLDELGDGRDWAGAPAGGRRAVAALVGSRLHATITRMILDICRRVRREDGLRTVALSGGVFQNRLLTDMCEVALSGDGFDVLTHALVPTNDGGLSLGQAAVAGYTLLHDPAAVISRGR
jgi:hydrogenase maturation protein HypF